MESNAPRPTPRGVEFGIHEKKVIMFSMTIEEFQNIDLRVGNIISVERVVGSEKLIKLEVDIGDDPSMGKRQIIAGIGKAYAPENLLGKQIVIVANLDPRQLMGLESQGMLLAAHGEGGAPVIITVEREVPPGSKIS